MYNAVITLSFIQGWWLVVEADNWRYVVQLYEVIGRIC